LDLLRGFDLRLLQYPLPDAKEFQRDSPELARLERFLKTLGTLLPTWSNNLSNLYFSHARTRPITIGE